MAKAFKPCSIDACKRNAHYSDGGNRGWCRAHYLRWLRNGDPSGVRAMQGESFHWLLTVAIPYDGSECLFWEFPWTISGYGRFQKDGKEQFAHRFVCEAVHGPPPTPDHECAHSCGNGHLGCVNSKHLRWATPSENNADRIIHGTDNRGERHGSSKLTEPGVREIRKLANNGVTHQEIADMHHISRSTVSLVISRKRWGWLD